MEIHRERKQKIEMVTSYKEDIYGSSSILQAQTINILTAMGSYGEIRAATSGEATIFKSMQQEIEKKLNKTFKKFEVVRVFADHSANGIIYKVKFDINVMHVHAKLLIPTHEGGVKQVLAVESNQTASSSFMI
jgi:hypothetical protein